MFNFYYELLIDEDLITKAVSWVLRDAAKYNPHNPETESVLLGCLSQR